MAALALLIALAALAVSCILVKSWAGFRAQQEEHRIALEVRLAEWRIRDITWSAMRQMLNAARDGVGGQGR